MFALKDVAFVKVEFLGGAHSVWKLLKMSHLNFLILAFFTNFCPNKTDLSGNTVWPQASDFQKLANMDRFGVVRFARNVKWDFFCDFQTPWDGIKT